jgi:hypothetical protein
MTAATTGQRLARSLGLGRAALALYYRPLGILGKSIAEGGPFEQRRTGRGREAMIEAAMRLAPLSGPAVDRGARVSFLTGAAYWYQTLFCFASLQAHTPERVTPVIYEDGTMTAGDRERLRRLIPWVELVSPEAMEARFDRVLPAHSFPTLRRQRLGFPIFLRQLTDVHVGAPRWTLYMDSDMLFFRRPEALEAWIGNPHTLYMQDVQTSYGYSPSLMRELAGRPVSPCVNAGLYALFSPGIDWERVEYWCRTQIEREGPHYLQPQGLIALLMASAASPQVLPPRDYLVLPGLAEGRAPTAVLHHYVAHSKRSYFQHGWRHVLGVLEQMGAPA